MAADLLRQKQTPWCTLFLVIGALTCHLCVLIGNYKTASAMQQLGKSTNGWSRVGLGLSQSLENELDVTMNKVSQKLLESLGQISIVQDTLDIALSFVGNETDAAVSSSPELSLLQQDPKALALLQQGDNPGAITSLVPVLEKVLHGALSQVMDKVIEVLHKFLETIKPALEQVGQWAIKFGDKIMSGIEAFSITLDRVQKIFDQVMAQLNGHGENYEELLDEAYSLFNVDGKGEISAADLQDVADLYSITALQGNKSDDLVQKYDSSGNGQLSFSEMNLLLNDASVPDLLVVVLRTFARRMSEIGGNVAAARQRDEVADSVAQYLGLVAAKNMTRVEWLSDALGNGSLPLEFTADLLIQLCLDEDDQNKLQAPHIGRTVTQTMFRLHPSHTLSAVDLLSNTSYFASEGFDVHDQPVCLRRVTEWLQTSNATGVKPAAELGNLTLMQVLSGSGHSSSEAEAEVLAAAPAMAQRLAEEGVALHLLEKQQERERRRSTLFHTQTSKLLLVRLLGGISVADAPTSNVAASAQASGQLAKPETLEFARWLAANATGRADAYQDMCFQYSSASSSAMDSFATQIQGMVKNVQSFINIMMKYSSPKAIDRLEKQVMGFAEKALADVSQIVEERLVHALNMSAPKLEGAIHSAAHEAGVRLGRAIGSALATPLGQALEEPISNSIGDMAQSAEIGDLFGPGLSKSVGDLLANISADVMGNRVGDAIGDWVESAIDEAVSGVGETVEGLTLLEVEAANSDLPPAVSGAWQELVDLLKSMTTTLPTSVSSLKFARKEVSKLYSNFNSIFNVFEQRGPVLFDTVASLWRKLWTIYFLVQFPLCLLVLYYGFWASGWFGGPQPFTAADEQVRPPRNFVQRCRVCCRCCCACMTSQHDNQVCFWSMLVLMQIVVLVVFLLSIVLCILAGIKALLVAGCDEIYPINDALICTESLQNLRSFLSTFAVERSLEPLDDTCSGDAHLLACKLIQNDMVESSVLTTVFSLLGALFSFQLVIDSALLHEQAVVRRELNAKTVGEAASSQEEPGGLIA
mmetsp:Transcript_60675/g.130267  ORF Transcript_60675/g.130267 Transcript_60675/m.130267 type:complete len:1039 (-) Transcript_60675:95-3211(-)